jgi:ParB family chromosome partitioning protein
MTAAAQSHPPKPTLAQVAAERMAAKPAPTAAPTQRILIDSILPSPFNPRKVFDVDGLADSIKAQGLLENIVVRKRRGGGFEIVAGERRWRACKQLKLTAIDCKVIEADDGDAMAAQIVENLQREDIGPLEEADGFRRLQDSDPVKWTAQAIADAIGCKTKRFVLQRLAIARNLAPDLKARLAAGKLNIEIARTLAAAPQVLQDKVKNSWGVRDGDAEHVTRELRSHAVPVGHAAFDVEKYKGDFLEDGKNRFFADVEQFTRLQNAAVQAHVETLRKGLWKKARLVRESETTDWCWGDTLDRLWGHETKTKSVGKAKVGVEHLTAIVWIGRDRKLHQASGVVPATVAGKAKIASSVSGSYHGGQARESAGQRRSRLDFNDRLHAAMTAQVDVGLRAMLCEYLTGHGHYSFMSEAATGALHDALLPPPLAKMVKAHGWTDAYDAKVWDAVGKLPIAKVHKALAGYGARSHYRWDSHDGKKPKGFEKLIAARLKVAPRVIEPAKAPAKGSAK